MSEARRTLILTVEGIPELIEEHRMNLLGLIQNYIDEDELSLTVDWETEDVS